MAKTALQKIEAMLDKCGELLEDVRVDESMYYDERTGKALLIYAALDEQDLADATTEPMPTKWDRASFRAGMEFAAKMLLNHDIDFGVLD